MPRIPWPGIGEGVGLALALLFVFLMAFVPHLDTFREPRPSEAQAIPRLADAAADYAKGERPGYPHTVHVDENVHWVLAANVQRDQHLFQVFPVGESKSQDALLSLRGAVHERGFHLILAEAQALTGVPFQYLFLYLPAAWLAFTAFCLYALLRPHPAALPAAAFVGLIPTTARFLGPAFLVPIGFVLAWLPVVLILAEPAKRHLGAAALLLVATAWAFFVHLIGGFAAVGLLALSAVFTAPRERRSALLLLIVALAPALWIYRAFAADVQAELQREEGLPIDFTIFDGWGVAALFGWTLAMPFIVFRHQWIARTPLLALSAASAASLALIISSVAFDLNRYATYARWHPVFFLTAAVPLGYGVALLMRAVRDALAHLPGPGRLIRPTSAALAGATGLLAASLLGAPGVAGHMTEGYYHVIDDEDWARFTWIAANVGPDYEVFLAHPWKAMILTAVSGKEPHAVLAPGAPPVRGEDYLRFAQTGGSLEFFVLNDITLVISTGKPPFDEFVELAPGVWGLKPEIAHEIAMIRAEERARTR